MFSRLTEVTFSTVPNYDSYGLREIWYSEVQNHTKKCLLHFFYLLPRNKMFLHKNIYSAQYRAVSATKNWIIWIGQLWILYLSEADSYVKMVFCRSKILFFRKQVNVTRKRLFYFYVYHSSYKEQITLTIFIDNQPLRKALFGVLKQT